MTFYDGYVTFTAMAEDHCPKVIVWTSAERVDAVDQVLGAMGTTIEPVGIGGPRLGEIDALARRWDCPHEDDLRKLLVDHPSQYVFLASTAGVRRDDLLTAIGSGAIVLSMEPIASDFDELIHTKPKARSISTPGVTHASVSVDSGSGSPRTAGQENIRPGYLQWVPAFKYTQGWTRAADPDQVLGKRQMIGFDSFGQPDETSLFARLFDAWQTLLSLGEIPDTIDASLVGPLGESPENLRGMTGYLCAHGRCGDGCAVVLRVSDRAGRLGRTLHAIGSEGHLRVSDQGYQLFDAAGECLDSLLDQGKTPTFTELIAKHWLSLLNGPHTTTLPQPTSATHDAPSILACCQACLLSSRTGQPESPQKLLQLHGF